MGVLLLCGAVAVTAAEKRQLLAEHETISVFDGLKERKCRGRTAKCPDKCGHSGETAIFKIEKYIKHNKPGKYGSGKQTIMSIQLSPKCQVSPATKIIIEKLNKGDRVKLNWRHDYVSKDGMTGPEYVVTDVTPLTE
jgi:hypothetical protein